MRFLYWYKLIRPTSFHLKEIFSRSFKVHSGVSFYSQFLVPKCAKARIFGDTEYSAGSAVLSLNEYCSASFQSADFFVRDSYQCKRNKLFSVTSRGIYFFSSL